jgi:hypothetical protein
LRSFYSYASALIYRPLIDSLLRLPLKVENSPRAFRERYDAFLLNAIFELRECMNRRSLVMLVATALLVGIAIFYPVTNASAQGDAYAGRIITGTAYFISGPRPGRTLPFRLIIDRITTSEEVGQLNAALQSGGQDELLKTLSRIKAGRIEIGSGVGIPANAIMVTDEGDGRTKMTVLYERNLRFAELRYGARSTNYKFGYAELYVGRGENQGMLIPAAYIRLRDGNTWEVEDFGTFPAKLMGLQVRGGSRNVAR